MAGAILIIRLNNMFAIKTWTARFLITSLLVSVVWLAGCGRQPEPKSAQIAPPPHPANDAALFLAGIPGRPDGPFHQLEQSHSWLQYSRNLNASWSRAEKEQFAPVDAFQKRELAPVHTKSSFVFYPFSGPDVLYATRFFPDGKIFVLAGLERVGSLRNAGDYPADTLDKELDGWNKALSSIFNRSFFVTSEMDSHFHGKVADGLLPMILLLMARSGYTVDGLQFGHVDESGKYIVETQDSQVRHPAVAIDFHKGADTTPRKLYYFCTRLDEPFEKNPSFSRFVKSQGTPDTLVKSASFLLHWKMCAAIRAQILETSNLIFQDDTGVAFHYFDNPDWNVKLYGEYSRPDRPFTNEYQNDLAAAFQDPAKVRPLGFSLGYGYGRRPSSMLLAVRVKK